MTTTPPSHPQGESLLAVDQGREAIAELAGGGHVAEWLFREGKGCQVIWRGKEQRAFFTHRDDACEALALLRADAILARLASTPREAGLREALEPFVRHGRAAGAFGDEPDPIRFYTDSGYREVPVADFRRARAALGTGESEA